MPNKNTILKISTSPKKNGGRVDWLVIQILLEQKRKKENPKQNQLQNRKQKPP